MAVLMILWGIDAHAEPTPSTNEELIARAYFRTGELAFEAGRFSDAAEQFERAAALSPRPGLLWNLARARDAARDPIRARQAYTRLLALPTPDLTAEELAGVHARLDALAHEIAHLGVRGGVDGAEIRVDGRTVASTPFAGVVDVTIGGHVVELEHPQVGRLRGSIRLAGGETKLFDASALVARTAGRGPPVYRRWWLWTAVGALVIGAATAGGLLGARAVDRASVPASALPEIAP